MSQSIQTIHEALDRLSLGGTLSREEARRVMDLILTGEVSQVQTAAFLMGLRVRGESEDEILGLVEGMRAASIKLKSQRQNVVDLCGTGGDRSDTFNISTAASLVVAGAGIPVAKHGNRAASSQCGSADVLEALGVAVDLSVEKARQAFKKQQQPPEKKEKKEEPKKALPAPAPAPAAKPEPKKEAPKKAEPPKQAK